MPGHGDHWETLYDVNEYVKDKLARDCQDSTLVCRHPCMDVKGNSERSEEVACLRYGNERFANQVLIVSDASSDSRFLFSGYPVALDGVVQTVTVDQVVPWEHGIEGWIHAKVTEAQISVSFFDTMYFAGTEQVHPGDQLEVSLAGLAYWLRPIQMRSFEIKEGPMWQIERERRLKDGESEKEASRPVEIQMTGASIFLPKGGDENPDDAQFQGVIDAVDSFEHDGHRIYRMEMVVMRPDDEEFRIAVFASEYVLDGYVPRLGEDVEGILWLQGWVIDPSAKVTPQEKHAQATLPC
jgi:hypothetical protein